VVLNWHQLVRARVKLFPDAPGLIQVNTEGKLPDDERRSTFIQYKKCYEDDDETFDRTIVRKSRFNK